MSKSKCADAKTWCNGCKSMTKTKRVSRAKHECVKCAYNKAWQS